MNDTPHPMGPEWQPELRGDLLELRGLRESDFDALYAVARDPLIWELHPARDRWQEPVFRELFKESMASGGAMIVFDRKSGEVIGSSRFFDHDPVRRTVEIGWSFLARAHWGGTYNRELKRLMLTHAYRYVDTVEFLVGPSNFRSRRALEKIGGKLIGERPNRVGRASVVYTLTRGEFEKKFAR